MSAVLESPLRQAAPPRAHSPHPPNRRSSLRPVALAHRHANGAGRKATRAAAVPTPEASEHSYIDPLTGLRVFTNFPPLTTAEVQRFLNDEF